MKCVPLLLTLFSFIFFPFYESEAVVSSRIGSGFCLSTDTLLSSSGKGTVSIGILIETRPAKPLIAAKKKLRFNSDELPRGWAIAFGIILLLLGTGNLIGGIFVAMLNFIGFITAPIALGLIILLLSFVGGIALGVIGVKLLFPKMKKKKQLLWSLIFNVVIAAVLYSLAWANDTF